MKKALIAGAAASLAMAAMPMAGVFATETPEDSVVDNLNVTLNETCTISRVGDYTGTNAEAGGDFGTTTANTYTTTIAASQAVTIGTSSFTVVCNDNAGWHVDLAVTGLNADTVANGTIDYSNTAITSGSTSGWYIASSDMESAVLTDGVVQTTSGAASVIKKGTSTASSTFDATYHVYAASNQAADTYTGTATYNLVIGSQTHA